MRVIQMESGLPPTHVQRTPQRPLTIAPAGVSRNIHVTPPRSPLGKGTISKAAAWASDVTGTARGSMSFACTRSPVPDARRPILELPCTWHHISHWRQGIHSGLARLSYCESDPPLPVTLALHSPKSAFDTLHANAWLVFSPRRLHERCSPDPSSVNDVSASLSPFIIQPDRGLGWAGSFPPIVPIPARVLPSSTKS